MKRASPRDRVRAGGDPLLGFLPDREAARKLVAASEGDTHAKLWRTHIDMTGGDLLWVQDEPDRPLITVVNAHNMALYAFEEAQRRGRLDADYHLVHIDYHPDFFGEGELFSPVGDSHDSWSVAHDRSWNDWITGLFARSGPSEFTDVSFGDLEEHVGPFIAAPVGERRVYLDAGLGRGELDLLVRDIDVPADGVYRLERPGGFTDGTFVRVLDERGEQARTSEAAVARVGGILERGRALEFRRDETGALLIDLSHGATQLVALATDEDPDPRRVPTLKYDADASAEKGVAIRRLARRELTLEELAESPPQPNAGGLALDVDLDYLDLYDETKDREYSLSVTPERIEAFAETVHRLCPNPAIMNIALSPEIYEGYEQAKQARAEGFGFIPLPEQAAGMREGRRRLRHFLRGWKRAVARLA